MPCRFPYCTPASARQTESTVTGWGCSWWNGTPPFLVITYSRRPVTLLPMSRMVLTTPCILSLPMPFSRCLHLLWILFPPFPHSRSHLLRILRMPAPPSLTLLSPPLPVHPHSRLIIPYSFLPSFLLGSHFLGVVFPPLSFLFQHLLSVVLIPCLFPFSRFLQVNLSLPSSQFSIFLSVVLPPFSFLFSPLLSKRWMLLQSFLFSLSLFFSLLSLFLSIVRPPLSFLLSHFLSIVRPPFSFTLSLFLRVGFLPRPVLFPLSTFRCLLPLPSSFGTRPALDVTCHSLPPPLKPLERHLTLITGQRRQYHTQVSNTQVSNTFPLSLLGPQCLLILFPPTLLKLATFLRILVRHRDQ